LISKKKLVRKLKNQQLKKIAIIGHTSVDPDSIASSFGMAYLVKKLNPKVDVDVLIDGISKHTNEVLSYFNENYKTESNPPYDLIIIVDVNVKTQLGKYEPIVMNQNFDDVIIIDHHVPTDFSKEIQNSYIFEEKKSTAELVVELLFFVKAAPPEKLLTILLSGIIYDSRRFFSLDLQLLKIVEQLLEKGANYDKAVDLIQKSLDKSERIARLKCAKRLKGYKIKDWIVVWSRVGSHEGSSARGLIDLGADVAIIYSKRKNETRLSIRATRNFSIHTKINFAKDVMKLIGNQLNGDGGGHSTAAALTIPDNISEEQLMKQVFKILEEKLESKLKEL
jgi:nanoRNase/pAp phosphatase (c-di-AMP/oligoRNAs hydrolase)